MNNFNFCVPTDIRFGKGQVECLPTELAKYGKKILLVYGGGSIKKTGLYDKLMGLLKQFEIFELPGIEPNPKLTSVEKGAEICKKEGVDVILAVGGGSCIDASKHIACAAYYDGAPWDLVLDRSKVTKALPIAVVLTICATGSEMNSGAVISNEETKEKLEINTPLLYPTLSVCDPTYLFTLPAKQTAAGTADIISHVMEQYFQPNDGAYLTDRLSESVLKTCFHYGPVAMKEPENYEARSNLMWDSSMAEIRIIKLGKKCDFEAHQIEHQMGAYTDCSHGMGLAVIHPTYYRHIYKCGLSKFTQFATNVWGISPEGKSKEELALAGIDALENFIREIGLPLTLKGLGFEDKSLLKTIADSCVINQGGYKVLTHEEILEILEECWE